MTLSNQNLFNWSHFDGAFYSILNIVIIGVLWCCIVTQTKAQDGARFRIDDLTIKTGHNQVTFKIEIAETDSQRAKGLMWRRHLAKNSGMLFDFKTTSHVSMWMKNTYIPLDILFIAKDGSILNIVRNSTPHSTRPISSAGPVRAVLELLGGSAEHYGIKAGDRVIHSLFEP